MKTKKHVRITTMRTLLVIAFFAFIGISVHAQDIWNFIQEFDSKSENTVTISGERNVSKFPNNIEALFEAIPLKLYEVKEEKLKLENWMVDEKFWDVTNQVSFTSEIEEEPKLKLEDWMLDERNFEVRPQKEVNPEYAGTNYAHHNILSKKLKLEK